MLLRTRRMNCIILGRAPNARLIHLSLHVHLIPRNLHRPFWIILPHRSRIQHIIHHYLSLNILIFHQSLIFIRTALFYLIDHHAHENIAPLLLINIHHFRRSKCVRFHGLVNPGQWLHDHVAAAAAIRLGISESDLWQGGTGGQAPWVPMIAAPWFLLRQDDLGRVLVRHRVVRIACSHVDFLQLTHVIFYIFKILWGCGCWCYLFILKEIKCYMIH